MINSLRIRVTIVFLFFIISYLVIIGNLFFIQIWNRQFFSTMGEHQYSVTTAQLPDRAPIFDRSGNHYLATNKECVSAFLIPNQIKNYDAVHSFLKINFPHADELLVRKKDSSFMYIKRRLVPSEVEIIESAHLADIHLLQESSRFYPVPSCCPLLGFTNIDNEGLAGMELECDAMLAGKPTIYELEKDARSGYFHFKKELQEEGTVGNPITLTLDKDLQFLVDEQVIDTVTKWNAQAGAALILDPTTGDILAMSSYPYTTLESPQFNIEETKHRVVSDAYELGSVIKVFAALAALEEGVVTPTELIDCHNSKTCIIEGRKINTTIANGLIPFTDVMAFSNNIGIAQVAKRVGPALYDHYTRLGFGTKTGIHIPAEHAGFVNHPSNWSKQSIISLSYGYEISATLLQLACAFSVLANDGCLIKPRILKTDPIIKSAKLYSSESIETMRDILQKTTEYGTGFRAKIPGYKVLCKTGTANLLIDGEYNHERNIFTCAAIVSKDSYTRVIISFIKEAQAKNAFASTIAVPLIKNIAEQMIIHERAIT